MYRLLNILGFVAFVIGAAFLGYALYLFLAGSLGLNPWGTARPTGGRDMMITSSLIGLALIVLGVLLAWASARLEVRRRGVIVVERPLTGPAAV